MNDDQDETTEEPVACSPVAGESCRLSKSRKCTCACGGVNHGKGVVWPRPKPRETVTQ